MTIDMAKLKVRYVSNIRKKTGRARPELFMIVLEIIKSSGYAITTERLEFLVRFKY